MVYCLVVIKTMLPPLSEGLIIRSGWSLSLLMAFCWAEVKFVIVGVIVIHLISLIMVVKNAQILAFVIRSGNFGDLFLNVLIDSFLVVCSSSEA